MIEPWLMSTDPRLLNAFADEPAARRRPDALIVDWERSGKLARQSAATELIGFTPSMGADEPTELASIRARFNGRLIVRINSVGESTSHEIAIARQGGADDVLVPMIRTVDEASTVMRLAGPSLGVGLMLETDDAIQQLGPLLRLRPTFCFLGLVDLALDRKTPNLFAPLIDGVLDTSTALLRDAEIPFGFGGLTLPGHGAPVPVDLLLGEMTRRAAGFGILRRTFLTDLGPGNPGDAVEAIRSAIERAAARQEQAVAHDRSLLVDVLTGM